MEQFTANEVRDWERAYKGTGAAKVFGAFADLLEAQEKAVPVMVVNHVSSAEHDLPIGMKLYAHPVPADAEKRDTMTPRELAKRIERGEKWKLADEPAPCQSQNAKRLAEALRVTDEMVERACKKHAFREDGAVFPDAYTDEEVLAERVLMREFLEHVLLAAQENPMADTMTLEELRESLDVGCLPNTDRPRWFAAIDAAIKQHEQDKLDAARMEWYFGPSDKKDWLDTYMRGMREGWSVGQWRAAIDTAMEKESGR